MQSYSQDLRDRVLRALARGVARRRSRDALRSAASMSTKFGTGNKRPGCVAVFRSVVIAAPGWRERSRPCAAGLQPSRG